MTKRRREAWAEELPCRDLPGEGCTLTISGEVDRGCHDGYPDLAAPNFRMRFSPAPDRGDGRAGERGERGQIA